MFSEVVAAHAHHPHKMHPLPEADVVGQSGVAGQGPFLRIYLKLSGDCIEEASFETYGCPSAIASGSWVTQWAEGRTTTQVSVLEAEDLLKVLGGLPLGKEHCAQMAVTALREAIRQAQAKSNNL